MYILKRNIICLLIALISWNLHAQSINLDNFEENNLIKWLAPKENPQLSKVIFFKKWGNDSQYVAAVCSAVDSVRFKYIENRCSKNNKLFLGVFYWNARKMVPVAKTDIPIAVPVSWTNSNLDSPVAFEFSNENVPDYYTGLDLAPYIIRKGKTAIGLRASFFEGYAGGGASFEVLQLFMIKGKNIVNVLSEPMNFDRDLAGEWNDDGTRQHDLSEGHNILIIQSSKHHRYNDLLIKSLDSNWKKYFRWSLDLDRYEVKK